MREVEFLFRKDHICTGTVSYTHLDVYKRQAGDIATCYCDATKAKNELHWVAERGLDEMCEDSWRWQSQNPDGYGDK